MPTVKILLADDNARFRQRVKEFLASEPDIQVIGEAANGREAIRKAEDLRPNLILMDLMMPGMNGLEATRRLHRNMPTIKIIILTMFETAEFQEAAMHAGAGGYVVKKDLIEALLPAIRQVTGTSLNKPALSEVPLNSDGHAGEPPIKRGFARTG